MNKFSFVSRCLLAILIFLFFSTNLWAVDEVYFAGFSYSSSFDSIKEKFPYTTKINQTDSNGVSFLDAQMLKFIRSNSTNFKTKVNLSDIAKLKDGDAIVLSLSLENETAYQEVIAGKTRLVIDLALQALYFDFNTMTVVGAFPISVQYIHVESNKVSEADIQQYTQNLYIDSSLDSVFKVFKKHLETVQIKERYSSTLQVSKVSLNLDNISNLLPSVYKINSSSLEETLAQSFGKYLSANQGVPVLPYSKSAAIGGKMTARFADGRVYNLKIPEPDYTVSLTLEKLKKVKYSENSSGVAWIYGGLVNFKVEEPFSGKVYADLQLKNAVTKVVPASQANVVDWPVYEEALFNLFYKLSKEISSPSKKWAKSHSKSPKTVKQLKKVKEVIEKCK